MNLRPPDVFAFSVSIALHLVIGGLLWFGLPDHEERRAVTFVPVQAVYLDASRSQLREERAAEARRQAEIARKKAEAEARRRAEAERRRREEARKRAEEAARLKAQREAEARAAAEAARLKAEAQAKAKAAAEAKARAEAEKRRQAEIARQKAEEKRQRKIAAQQRAKEQSEAMLKAALDAEVAEIAAAEAARKQAAQDQSDRAAYQRQLFLHIQKNWVRPVGTKDEFSCRIRIEQLPGGQIQRYELLESCGNPFLDASVEKALRRADPLPLPKNPRVFDRKLTLTFKP